MDKFYLKVTDTDTDKVIKINDVKLSNVIKYNLEQNTEENYVKVNLELIAVPEIHVETKKKSVEAKVKNNYTYS